MSETPSYLSFDKPAYAWKPDIDYRKSPEEYKVGKGEQGVLICEPYKSEIGQHWRFKTEAIAKESSDIIYQQFLEYLKQNDFVGADMARKYLQMGYTRARRYANYKGGKKYDKLQNYKQLERGTGDEEKAKAAAIFYEKWKVAEGNNEYSLRKKPGRNKLVEECWNLLYTRIHFPDEEYAIKNIGPIFLLIEHVSYRGQDLASAAIWTYPVYMKRI